MLFELQAQVQWAASLVILFSLTRLAGWHDLPWWLVLLPGLILLGQVGVGIFVVSVVLSFFYE